MAKEKPAIRVGQVYRDKDKREVRYVVVMALAVSSAWCVPCFEHGALAAASGRRSRYILKNALQSRFELVKDAKLETTQ